MLTLNTAGLAALWFTGSLSAVEVGLALVAAVWLYNRVTKHWPVIGALNMGACRGLSVALGALVGPIPHLQPLGFFIAILFALYIAAVTNLARHETRERVPVLARLLPLVPATLCALPGIGVALQAPARMPAMLIFALIVGNAGWLAVKMFRRPAPPLPPMIGAHIRLLLPMQAAFCFLAEPWGSGRVAAITLLACWPLSRMVSRRFYAS